MFASLLIGNQVTFWFDLTQGKSVDRPAKANNAKNAIAHYGDLCGDFRIDNDDRPDATAAQWAGGGTNRATHRSHLVTRYRYGLAIHQERLATSRRAVSRQFCPNSYLRICSPFHLGCECNARGCDDDFVGVNRMGTHQIQSRELNRHSSRGHGKVLAKLGDLPTNVGQQRLVVRVRESLDNPSANLLHLIGAHATRS